MKYWKIILKDCHDHSTYEGYDNLVIFCGEKVPEKYISTIRFISEREKPFKFKNKEWEKFAESSQRGRISRYDALEEITEKELRDMLK